MTMTNSAFYTARQVRTRGRAPKVEWTPERLTRLQEMCGNNASLDDLMIAFGVGSVTTIAVGMRLLIGRLSAGLNVEH